jgi:hypothetical protein
MLQRLQTLYFLIAAILCVVPMFGGTLFTFVQGKTILEMSVYQVVDLGVSMSVKNDSWVLLVIVVALLFATIFSFKQQKRQLTFALLCFVLHVITVGWMLFGIYIIKTSCTSCTEPTKLQGIGMPFFVFVAAAIFIFMGIKGVRKDKKLLDSLNRLR